MAKFKDKERILKVARQNHLVTYKGVLIRQYTGFSTEILQDTRE